MNILTIIEDLIAAGFPRKIADVLAKLQSFEPKHWKGNLPPNTHHFDAITKFASGAHVDKKTLWVEFDYTDAGVAHTLTAESPAAEFGHRGAHCTLTVDGVSEPGQMVIGHREGIDSSGFYERAIFEFYYGTPEVHVRFDGDLATIP